MSIRFFVPGALLLLSAALVFPANAQQTAQGVVFHDKNQNRERDLGEAGVEGISVSNGRMVVQTGSDGRYELPVRAGDAVFVTQPTGYTVPVDEQNRPQFYYLHDPDGTPDSLNLRFPGVEPTEALPESIDFPLYKQEREATFTAVALADPQAASHEQLRFVREDVVDELVGTDAAFGITVGDLVHDDLSLYPRYLRLISQIDIPWWRIPGNHDMNYRAPSDEHATETYKRFFGPTNYSFEYGDVHFIALDNVQYAGAGKSFQSGSYRGSLTTEQLKWIEQDLRAVPEDKLIVVATHIPLRTNAVGDTTSSWRPGTTNLGSLLDVLEGYRVYSISGHDTSNSWHVYLDDSDGWNGPTPLHHHVLAEVRGGAWQGPRDVRDVPAALMEDGNPNGYYFLDFEGDQYEARFKPASQPSNHQVRVTVHQPRGEQRQAHAGAWSPPSLFVNVFDGGPKTTVQYWIDDGEPRSMSRTIRPDPFVTHLLNHGYLEDSPETKTTPDPSSHLWTAPLPSDVTPGVHTVTVKTENEFGRIDTTTTVLEVQNTEEDPAP